MLKSLFSGISGLQSHQVAMDVESNNIANVNTIGFKYSRANFSDLLAQVNQIATAPQGNMGGKNATQVGLGATVSSMTRIFSQGSVQNTDKNTDVAIQGDGFFIVSSDGGDTLKYSRNGDFKFDSEGNFVDNNGFIVQGWLRDEVTGNVDSTGPIESIIIPPGLTTPARASTQVVVKANLNSGITVESKSQAYNVDSDGVTTDANGNIIPNSENMNIMYNDQGEAFSLTQGQGIWMSTRAATLTTDVLAPIDATPITMTFTHTDSTTTTVTVPGPSITATTTPQQAAILLQNAINAKSAETGIEATLDAAGTSVVLTNNNETDGDNLKNIRVSGTSGGLTFGGLELDPLDDGVDDVSSITAFKYTYHDSSDLTAANASKTFHTVNGLRESIQNQLRCDQAISAAAAAVYSASRAAGNTSTEADDDVILVTDWFTANYPAWMSDPAGSAELAALDAETNSASGNAFTGSDAAAKTGVNDFTVTVDETGAFVVANADQGSLGLQATFATTGLDGSSGNIRFSESMQALSGILTGTADLSGQAFTVPTHSSSIDIFDSLGSTHTVTTNFRKTTLNNSTGSQWNIVISVPEPATIDTTLPYNEKTGYVKFNNDGSFAGQSPQYISFSANNGSAGQQKVNIEFGTTGGFDGLTSFTGPSTTSGISQDGYTGGDLDGIRIDQSGTLIGGFSNGRSFGLGQISMAKFANNEGLLTDGGNIYLQSANSGEPIRGTAATGGRGFIQSSALEASNVDLSRSLTQLIIIQKGFQANSKTITTSDQLLETLIGLKR
jgi:flagellar hook protein FlgE